jgi:hypothetical protein
MGEAPVYEIEFLLSDEEECNENIILNFKPTSTPSPTTQTPRPVQHPLEPHKVFPSHEFSKTTTLSTTHTSQIEGLCLECETT